MLPSSAALAAAALAAALAAPVQAATKRNVLYFIADDLRPEFAAAFGQKQMLTPNVDKLASEGLVFNAAYCQQAVCGPSRASFMTGRRPAHTNIFGNSDSFREMGGDTNGPGSSWITMPVRPLLLPVRLPVTLRRMPMRTPSRV